MKSRNLTVDIARGFIVLIMPATHVTLYYSMLSVQEGVLGGFLRCFAEGAGAPLFMVLLGFSFFLGRKKSVKFIGRRSIAIFLLAYSLNFMKFVLPVILGLIPDSFFAYYHIPTGIFGAIDLLMVGDIFQFAAISYFICGVLHRFQARLTFVLGLGLIITIISPITWGVRLDNFLLDYLLKLFNGYPPAVFFPFFPWGVYPLLGYALGMLHKRMLAAQFYRTTLLAGALCIIIGILGIQIEPESYNLTFYRLGPCGTILHCGLVLLWLNICHFIAVRLREKKYFTMIISWCSMNITVIYIIQWIMIAWLFPFFGFMKLDMIETLNAILIISALTVLGVFVLKVYKQKRSKNSTFGPKPGSSVFRL